MTSPAIENLAVYCASVISHMFVFFVAPIAAPGARAHQFIEPPQPPVFTPLGLGAKPSKPQTSRMLIFQLIDYIVGSRRVQNIFVT